ncbi:MAG TPA: aminodeoxychorismate synthase component I [Balneola sp.]|jgi:para-aminobenzoate synthetase component I|nr:aminodeoxychorismate synthase, component I [Balneola sp.]MAO78733.1 aminodeoxychorismate synthase, component I [Balneola sp.]MBF64752.1 aminodeoxychorismate synthase, component I [Balneola sp.]HAH51790.1 aminodeoxychorismate synthase component I [Balneola sp.]HAW81959.1 aminodeoxychorismate synthase component I [Balneola sp.]|tara:strand:- start:9796 stop:11058 length:1263 start_codon:yes stop_codon:yes gene_type:complete
MKDIDQFIASIHRYYSKKEDFFLLESQMHNHPASNNSFIAVGSSASVKAFGNKIQLKEHGKEITVDQNPWEALQEFKRRNNDEWIFGYLSYDLKNFIEDLNSINEPLLETPDLFFFVPELLIKIDKYNNVEVLKGALEDDLSLTEIKGHVSLSQIQQTTKAAYLEKIKVAQNLIREGEFYEINLSHPLEFEFKGRAWDLYQKMKTSGPVPFGSYIKHSNFEICSSSPERFLSKKGSLISSQPIKGTVSRSDKDDQSKIQELLNSEKEQAENLMIVDLVRHDLSRIAKNGSVGVKNLFEIQSFETVHQMVSTVEAEVKEGISAVEILKACFPMGSMTGAPKIAAMRVIDELEDYRRGIYSGAIGYFSPEDDFDFSVVIRTAIIQKEKLFYPVGGAITYDSNPEQEWEETILKAKALTNIVN